MKNQLIDQKIKIYNSISQKKEIFVPIVKGYIGIYICGPTVYNKIHLGNCRTFISFDLVVRYFKYLGYKVRYVRNITDVGHLENSLIEEESEDKISKRARIEHLEPMEIVQKYTLDFRNILSLFNTLHPDIEPTATGHISEQIEIIKKLINRKLAYERDGSVYFDLQSYDKIVENNPKYKKYGVLSRNKMGEFLMNTRDLKGQHEKKHSKDFAIWKKANKRHIMRWPSPWGEGFPGWHLECTTMSTKYLGKVFDIHGGGIDLKFPHHECEIAQSQGAYGKSPVNYWMHINMLTFNGQKMSKSTCNTLYPFDIFTGKNSFLKKSFSFEVMRFFILQAHYRSVLDFSNHALSAAEKGYHRLMIAFINLEKLSCSKKEEKTSSFNVQEWRKNCYDSMNDDFNSPRLIACLFEVCPLIDGICQGKKFLSLSDLKLLKTTMQSFYLEVLGLVNPLIELKKSLNLSSIKNSLKQKYFLSRKLSGEDFITKVPLNDLLTDPSKFRKLLDIIIKIREKARKNKYWAFSDEIRNELLKLGYTLSDNQDGTTSIDIHE